MKSIGLYLGALPLLLLSAEHSEAFDSYRYLHVTVETPWSIFLFLLIGVFAPFILMAVLVWRHSGRKPSVPAEPHSSEKSEP